MKDPSSDDVFLLDREWGLLAVPPLVFVRAAVAVETDVVAGVDVVVAVDGDASVETAFILRFH